MNVELNKLLYALVQKHDPESLLSLDLHFDVVVSDQLAESVNQLPELRGLSVPDLNVVLFYEVEDCVQVLESSGPVVCGQRCNYVFEVFHDLRVYGLVYHRLTFAVWIVGSAY